MFLETQPANKIFFNIIIDYRESPDNGLSKNLKYLRKTQLSLDRIS